MSWTRKIKKLPDGDYLSPVNLRYNDAFFLRLLLDDFIEHLSEQRLCDGADAVLMERAQSCKNTITTYLNTTNKQIKSSIKRRKAKKAKKYNISKIEGIIRLFLFKKN